jgi:hypothetical protein
MTETTTTTATPETDAPAQLGLTVQDLTLTLQLIQVASTRGAFKAEELSTVGGLYDRIFKFLEASGAITKQDPNAIKTDSPAPVVSETAA